MNKHRIGLDDTFEGILETAEDRGVSKSEFIQRALLLAAIVADIEGVDTLPEADIDEEDAKEWARQNYPTKRLPERVLE